MNKTFRVLSKHGDFEGVLEVGELREVPVGTEHYEYIGAEPADHEYVARVARSQVTRVDPVLVGAFSDDLVDELRRLKAGDEVALAKFGDKYELHNIEGGYDIGVRYALEEL